MSKTLDELMEPVEAMIADAKLVAFDGCQKIYLAIDDEEAKWFRENYLKVGDNFETLPTFLTENDINSFEKKTGDTEEAVEEPKPAKTAKTKAKKPSKPKPKAKAKPAKKGKRK